MNESLKCRQLLQIAHEIINGTYNVISGFVAFDAMLLDFLDEVVPSFGKLIWQYANGQFICFEKMRMTELSGLTELMTVTMQTLQVF